MNTNQQQQQRCCCCYQRNELGKSNSVLIARGNCKNEEHKICFKCIESSSFDEERKLIYDCKLCNKSNKDDNNNNKKKKSDDSNLTRSSSSNSSNENENKDDLDYLSRDLLNTSTSTSTSSSCQCDCLKSCLSAISNKLSTITCTIM